MVGRILSLIVTLLIVHNVYCQNPPVINDSYIAWGEIVQPIENVFTNMTIQTSFEESYNAKTQNAAFFLYELGKNLTFVKDYANNQTFLYVETGDNMTVTYEDDPDSTEKPKLRCLETNEKQWLESDVAPGLLSFEDDDGTIKFSIKQLLNIPIKYMMSKLRGVKTAYRGIPALSWTYLMKTKIDDINTDITVQSFWSDGTWNTSAGPRMTPLGFNVSKSIQTDPVKVEDYVVNVFGFVPGGYDHKYFKAIQGVVCPNRKATLKFPNVRNIQAISFHSELALPDYQELRYVDTWFDPANQLVRIDMERLDDEDPLPTKKKRYQSEIAIGQLGIVYRWGWDRGESHCEIIPFKDYKNDMQNLFDIKQSFRRWQMGKIFGLNDTSYVYIGKTSKNNIPCHLFQGVRTDWPDKDSKIESLWEWCFNDGLLNKDDAFLFQGDGLGLISANVIVLSDPQGIYNNYRLNHHFYEVKAQDPKILDATSFDIGRCFPDTEKRVLQFYLNVKVGLDNKIMFENATSDVTFLQRWKDALYANTGLKDYSLRISNVRATIGGDKVYIKFSILSVHKDLPKAIQDKEIEAFDAEKTLRDSVNAGNVKIMYQLRKGETAVLAAEKHSVSFQIDPKFEPQTLPPLPEESTTENTFIFSLRTEPDKGKTQTPGDKTTASTQSPITGSTDALTGSTDALTGSTDALTGSTDSRKSSVNPDDGSTTPPPEKKKKVVVKYSGNAPGAVAGTAIAMLLVGVTIGAGGTFYKFNGLPECMKR